MHVKKHFFKDITNQNYVIVTGDYIYYGFIVRNVFVSEYLNLPETISMANFTEQMWRIRNSSSFQRHRPCNVPAFAQNISNTVSTPSE